MTLDELLKCCDSRRWAERMLALQPFADRDAMYSAADSLWWSLEPSDWLKAFAAHPRIGASRLSGWCAEEQSGAGPAPEMAQANAEYENRFGWIFLINATGKTAPEMLDALRQRLQNAPEEELRVAASEQAQITKLRLGKLLGA